MELKGTNRLHSLVEKNLVEQSERGNSDKRSFYDISFSPEDGEESPGVDSKVSEFPSEELKFSTVTTLDWLQTWRSTEIS